MKVVYTTAARSDLIGIAEWIAQDNPARAESFANEIQDACDSLADMARAFPLLPRHSAEHIRRKPYRSYLIFYRIKRNAVEILRVLHAARDYERILFPK